MDILGEQSPFPGDVRCAGTARERVPPVPARLPAARGDTGDSLRWPGPKRGQTVLRGENEGKICPVSCLQSHGSASASWVWLFWPSSRPSQGQVLTLRAGYFMKLRGREENAVTQRALFYNPRNPSVLIYSITFHHLNIHVMFTKEKTVLKLFTGRRRGGNSLNMTHTQCNQELHSDRNELPGESQTKRITGTQVSILN